MMTKDLIRYDLLVQDALKGVVRKVLGDAARDGLNGDHHFYVSFRTEFPGVRLSARMREKYPQEMTIVLQHQFWDLGVTEHSFEVGLSFSGIPERLLIPFDALTGFFDPSVQFGLKFEVQEAPAEAEPVPVADISRPTSLKTPPRGAGSEPQENQPKPTASEPRAVPARPAAAKDAPKPAVKPAAKAPARVEGKSAKTDAPEVEQDDAAAEAPGGAQVVSLDSFRKKTPNNS
jgi:hypothetical protein